MVCRRQVAAGCNWIKHSASDFGSEEARPVAALAVARFKLRDGQHLQDVDARRGQIGNLFYDIEKRAAAQTGALKEVPNVQLIDDRVVERGWAEALIVPRICIWISDDTIAIFLPFPCIWITFVAARSLSHHVKLVGVTCVGTGDESVPSDASPDPLHCQFQVAITIPRIAAVEPTVDVDGMRQGSPNTESCPYCFFRVGWECGSLAACLPSNTL